MCGCGPVISGGVVAKMWPFGSKFANGANDWPAATPEKICKSGGRWGGKSAKGVVSRRVTVSAEPKIGARPRGFGKILRFRPFLAEFEAKFRLQGGQTQMRNMRNTRQLLGSY